MRLYGIVVLTAAAGVASAQEPGFSAGNAVSDALLEQIDVAEGVGNHYNVVGIESVAEQNITGETNVAIDTNGGDIVAGNISISGTLGANGVGNYMVNTGIGNTLGQAINLNLILYGAVPAGVP